MTKSYYTMSLNIDSYFIVRKSTFNKSSRSKQGEGERGAANVKNIFFTQFTELIRDGNH